MILSVTHEFSQGESWAESHGMQSIIHQRDINHTDLQ